MRSTDSGFSENVYIEASKDRLKLANSLMEEDVRNYVMICYIAGVAVECLFHAYRMRAGVDDTAKHNLAQQANRSGFFDGMTSKERQRLSIHLSEVVARWQNNHRYRSETALSEYIANHRLFVIEGRQTTGKGNLLHNTELLLDAANELVTAGVKRWTL